MFTIKLNLRSKMFWMFDTFDIYLIIFLGDKDHEFYFASFPV